MGFVLLRCLVSRIFMRVRMCAGRRERRLEERAREREREGAGAETSAAPAQTPTQQYGNKRLKILFIIPYLLIYEYKYSQIPFYY